MKIWAPLQENLTLLNANNKGVDQPAHPCSLISGFVIRLLESFMQNSNILTGLFSSADWFEFYLIVNPEDRFSRVAAKFIP